jgi:hypothetical protein
MSLSSYHTSNNKFRFYILKQDNSIVYPNDKGHVALKHEDVFKIKVNNPLPVRMQIDVYLNGKVGDEQAFIGAWILSPFQEATLETYKSNGEQFTFVRKDSTEFSETVAPFVSDDDYGRVSVWFRSEEQQHQTFSKLDNLRSGEKGLTSYSDDDYHGSLGGETTRGYNAGGIALSGSSNQQFGTTDPITKWGDVNVIYDVRLVEQKITSLYSLMVPKHSYSV